MIYLLETITFRSYVKLPEGSGTLIICFNKDNPVILILIDLPSAVTRHHQTLQAGKTPLNGSVN